MSCKMQSSDTVVYWVYWATYQRCVHCVCRLLQQQHAEELILRFFQHTRCICSFCPSSWHALLAGAGRVCTPDVRAAFQVLWRDEAGRAETGNPASGAKYDCRLGCRCWTSRPCRRAPAHWQAGASHSHHSTGVVGSQPWLLNVSLQVQQLLTPFMQLCLGLKDA